MQMPAKGEKSGKATMLWRCRTNLGRAATLDHLFASGFATEVVGLRALAWRHSRGEVRR